MTQIHLFIVLLTTLLIRPAEPLKCWKCSGPICTVPEVTVPNQHELVDCDRELNVTGPSNLPIGCYNVQTDQHTGLSQGVYGVIERGCMRPPQALDIEHVQTCFNRNGRPRERSLYCFCNHTDGCNNVDERVAKKCWQCIDDSCTKAPVLLECSMLPYVKPPYGGPANAPFVCYSGRVSTHSNTMIGRGCIRSFDRTGCHQLLGLGPFFDVNVRTEHCNCGYDGCNEHLAFPNRISWSARTRSTVSLVVLAVGSNMLILLLYRNGGVGL